MIKKKGVSQSVVLNFSPCSYHCDGNCLIELCEASEMLVACERCFAELSAFLNE